MLEISHQQSFRRDGAAMENIRMAELFMSFYRKNSEMSEKVSGNVGIFLKGNACKKCKIRSAKVTK